jgi:hypothetical protein
MLKRLAVLWLAAALGAPMADAATARAGPSEWRWSERTAWGGELPAEGDEVVIPAGATVILDTDTAALRGLRIDGTLRFAAADVELKADAIQVTGALQIGRADAPHRHRATITLTGQPSGSGNDGVVRGLNCTGPMACRCRTTSVMTSPGMPTFSKTGSSAATASKATSR